MNPLCNFCGSQRALVYCKSDSARLCLPCDDYVHATNALSRGHLRARICDGCEAEPAAFVFPDDGLALCQLCDLSVDPLRRRISAGVYSGCPTADELSAVFSASVLPCGDGAGCLFSKDLAGDGYGLCDGLEIGDGEFNLDCGGLFEWPPLPHHDFALEEILGEMNFSTPLPDFHQQNSVQASSSVPNECVAPLPLSMQAPNFNPLHPSSNKSINLDFTPRNMCRNMPFSLSSLSGEAIACDYRDCVGISPAFLTDEPAWDFSSEVGCPQARNEAKMRYNEKKKSRLFGKQIRYACRKAKADTRKRVKGRFVKAGEAYDYDPLTASK